jgi:hypothetical protein
MIERCHNPNTAPFKWYGANGIVVCSQWRWSFSKFLSDMGERPNGMTLDRIDFSQGYEPKNVRWASRAEQARNRGNVRLRMWAGEALTLKEIADRTCVPRTSLGKNARKFRRIQDAVQATKAVMKKPR